MSNSSEKLQSIQTKLNALLGDGSPTVVKSNHKPLLQEIKNFLGDLDTDKLATDTTTWSDEKKSEIREGIGAATPSNIISFSDKKFISEKNDMTNPRVNTLANALLHFELTTSQNSANDVWVIDLFCSKNPALGENYRDHIRVKNLTTGVQGWGYTMLRDKLDIYSYVVDQLVNGVTIHYEFTINWNLIPDDFQMYTNGYLYLNQGISKKSVTKVISDNADLDKVEGYKIWWCGTSLDAGDPLFNKKGYAEVTAEMLNSEVFNVAYGASALRRSHTGSLSVMPFQWARNLMQTKSEKEIIISNWDALYGNGKPALIDWIDQIRESSYETNLVAKYLNIYDSQYYDQNPNHSLRHKTDLFVIGHGYNDVFEHDSFFYSEPTEDLLSDKGYSLDPYAPERIDGYGNYQLPVYMNRNSYVGSLNFLIETIYRYNPEAKIVILGHYTHSDVEIPDGLGVSPIMRNAFFVHKAKALVANRWNIPYIEIGKLLGLSDNLLPNSKYLWDIEPWTSQYDKPNPTTLMSSIRYYCPDGVHMGSDPRRLLIKKIAMILADEFKKILNDKAVLLADQKVLTSN